MLAKRPALDKILWHPHIAGKLTPAQQGRRLVLRHRLQPQRKARGIHALQHLQPLAEIALIQLAHDADAHGALFRLAISAEPGDQQRAERRQRRQQQADRQHPRQQAQRSLELQPCVNQKASHGVSKSRISVSRSPL